MRLFACQNCGQIVFFENTICVRCAHVLGFRADDHAVLALEPRGEETWTGISDGSASATLFRFCRNREHDTCNWLIPSGGRGAFCLACRHNGTIPNLSRPENLAAWQRIEAAKHRLFYSLLRLRLPLQTRAESPENGLVFEFLADDPHPQSPKVLTGHDNGRITIALAEADDAERERRRASMGEPYRTLLGHFRHEIGHYYWDRLVRDGGYLDACRAVFGDDRMDYDEALKRHYARGGPPADWGERYISAYATVHPWEDFAETWAHYLHIVDTLEMAGALHLRTALTAAKGGVLSVQIDFDPYAVSSIEQMVSAWVPVALGANNLNRCMGQPDLYPFVITPAVTEKLGFIHRLVQRRL